MEKMTQTASGGYTVAAIVLAVGLVIASAVYTLHGPGTATSGASQPDNTISVAGDSVVTAMPDQAEIYVRTETRGTTALEAQQENRVIADKVHAALLQKGVKESDIETTSYDLQEEWQWENDRNVLKGYNLINTVKVTTKDVAGAGSIVDTAVEAGANGVDRISFTLSKEARIRVNAQALEEASSSAQQKAQSIADALGLRLGKAVRVTESNVNYQPFDFYPRAAMAMDKTEAIPPTVVSPQNVDVTANVDVAYMIK